MSFVRASWQGEKSLAKVFWLYHVGFVCSCYLALFGLMILHFSVLSIPKFIIIAAGVLAIPLFWLYLIWILVSLWRCAENSKPLWKNLVRIWIVLCVAGFAMLEAIVINAQLNRHAALERISSLKRSYPAPGTEARYGFVRPTPFNANMSGHVLPQTPWGIPNTDSSVSARSELFKRLDYDAVIAEIDKQLLLHPDDPEAYKAYNDRGEAYRLKRRFDDAIADYDRAVKLNPKYVKAYINRGLAKRRKGDVKQAIADYSKALEIDSDSGFAYSNRAEAYFFINDHDKALDDVHKALDLGYSINSGCLYGLIRTTGREK